MENNEGVGYEKIWTKFAFLDESGSLNDPKDPFFTIGFVKCSQPYYINSKLNYYRQKKQMFDELKFNKLSKQNFDFARLALESFFTTKSMNFCSYTLFKPGSYFNREFAGDTWKAYEDISIRLLESVVSKDEILIVIADYVSTPKVVKFEVNVKRRINQKLNRLAIAGVCRFNSKSNDLLQLTDLMIGAINYNLKLNLGIIKSGDKYKRRFVDCFKEYSGASEGFTDGFKSFNLNIFVDKSIKSVLPFGATKIEKEPSS